ncbi:SRPBCC family protein [Marinicella sediminis]|uniref:SRPBCC family protein n=1 Tax=Marinicella sediminis TaxID=1792834 RepID=A0ABV7J9B7_9GAMM|nr:SRPBCC family protein [Marinicella sediminis]
MKYQNTITVEVPISRFVELLDNPENMKHWQKGLQSYELLGDHEPGSVGAQMKLHFKMGKRDLTMIETVTISDFPQRFAGTYETKGVWNLVDNHFKENEQGHTVWIADCEFKFSGLMKVMSWFMPKSMFKKQSCQYLEDFKKFAEAQ